MRSVTRCQPALVHRSSSAPSTIGRPCSRSLHTAAPGVLLKLQGPARAGGRLCLATGSGATAVVEQALAHYYRDLFGRAALRHFALAERALGDGPADAAAPDR